MKNKLIITLFAFIIAISGCTSKTTNIKNGILLSTSKINVKVQFYSNQIVRVVKWDPKGTDTKKSLSVIMDSIPTVEITTTDENGSIVLKSKLLQVKISKSNGEIEYFDSIGNSILAEKESSFKSVTYKKDKAFSVEQQFKLSTDEGIYGLGQDQDGYMNFRGKTVTLVQTNANGVNPFLVSTQKYGILWDNYSKTIYKDDGKADASLWSDVADNIDYYFVAGKNLDEVIAGYRVLTGQAPMYGKWAYGYWQSKEHYHTGAELMSIAEKYRKEGYPIDNIVQDWDYWNGAQNWGSMTFDETIYPKAEEMIARLHKLNFHFMISIWPAVGPNTLIYKDMLQKGFLYPPVGWAGFKYYDAYNHDANKLYWDYLKKGLLDKGIDAWWMDSTEPDVVNASTRESSEYELKKMDDNKLGSWARYLNAFSLAMTTDFYKNYRASISDKRCYILTRSTYAGQQRNAATTWSGDIGASWDIFRYQISGGINHCMSGIPYYTFDIGSYVLGAYDGVFNKGGKTPSYQELYTRMFQFGAFCPIFRSHGSETPREIWEFGDFTQPILKYDILRYRLLPYIYSLAWKVTNDGYTIMRGLPMDFTADKNTFNIDDQFMFGPSFMVCPVTKYMYNKPPQPSIKIEQKYFKTDDGKPGLLAQYCKDKQHKTITKQQVEPDIDIIWYTGRPEYVTDSMFSIRWEGKLIPQETGRYQFHMKSFDAKRIFLNGKELPIVYTSVEQYTDTLHLEANKEYKFVIETENQSTGAARMQLFWKTPSIFANEERIETPAKTREVYLPKSTEWYNFWTGEKLNGGNKITANAPIDIMPLYVPAGSIIPMGPNIKYSTEKPADPIELRVYPGANGNFVLYEDENDNYNYEKGIYSTIEFKWNNAEKKLTIGKRNGEFPGMLKKRTFQIVIVSKNHGIEVQPTQNPDKTISYDGNEITVAL